MMRRAASLALMVAMSILLVGCATFARSSELSGGLLLAGGEPPTDMAPAAPPEPAMVEEERVAAVGMPNMVDDRMIVRTASMSLVVEDTEKSLEDIERLATQLEGYISNLNVWRVNEQLAATVTLRVPSQSFDEAR